MSSFSERDRQPLRDIVENADAIAESITDMTFAQFASDRKTIDAVERCLQRISEGVIQIGPEQIARVDTEISSVGIRGFDNFLHHEYVRVDRATVYHAATDDALVLSRAASRALAD